MKISLMSQSKCDDLFKNLNAVANEIKEEDNINPKDNDFIKTYYNERVLFLMNLNLLKPK